MAKENKITYERVDRKYNNYKRILVKFNPRFWGNADFEIEFIPTANALKIGIFFIKEIDSMSTNDLYPWFVREETLSRGLGGWERGYIPPIRYYPKMKYFSRGLEPFPRRVINHVKQVFEFVASEFNESISYIYNYFLWSGQLGSLPFANEDFNIEKLRVAIEGVVYPGFNAEGEVIRRPLVEHLFDTHKTEYIQPNICRFLEIMRLILTSAVEEHDKKQRQ